MGLALFLTGCVMNGKSYGPGAPSSSTTPSSSDGSSASASSSSPSSSGATDSGGTESAPGSKRYQAAGYSSAPVDPWLAVKNDEPVRGTPDDAGAWKISDKEAQCTAKIDHCLHPDVWFLVRASDLEYHRKGQQLSASPVVFSTEGPEVPWNAQVSRMGDKYVAFRTVPATKKHMVPGAIVIGLSHKSGLPNSGKAAEEASWSYNILEEAKLDLGVYQAQEAADTMPLTGARVAVLSWKPGEKVQILNGRKKEQLAVTPTEVFLPEQ